MGRVNSSAQYTLPPLSVAKKLVVAANAQNRVVSAGLKICPTSGCSFMPNFPKLSLLHKVVCFVSHLLLALFGLGDFQRRQIGCSCYTDDCFCMFLVCLTGYPDSIMRAELSMQYLHLLRHPWSVTQFCGVDFQLGLQLVSHPNKIHWFI